MMKKQKPAPSPKVSRRFSKEISPVKAAGPVSIQSDS